MKTALIGYGKMGREIEKMLLERGHEVVAIFDEDNPLTVNGLRSSGAEVAIEFTMPEAAFDNIAKCFEAGVVVVSGTTGWLARWDEALELCKMLNGGFFYASNYSLGVNLFFRLNEVLARMMERFSDYSVALSETHHIHKKDAPSGTAITIREVIGRPDAPIESIREGEVPGTHTVEWRSEVDRITLTHEAFSRLGLAAGAVAAAEFLYGKHGVFSMNDLMGQ